MDIRYQSEPLDHLIEECSELIKALCKAKRFGWQATDPLTQTSYNNESDVVLEMADVEYAIIRVKTLIRTNVYNRKIQNGTSST